IWVLPSGSTTSSMVRLPTTITRGRFAGIICVSLFPFISISIRRVLFGWNLTVGQTDINALVAIQEVSSDIPDNLYHNNTDYELERPLCCYSDRRINRANEVEYQ